MIYGTPAARSAEPSPAPAIASARVPSMPSRPNAGILTPQSPKQRTGARIDAAGIAAAFVLLGAALGYALHEPLDLLFGGL